MSLREGGHATLKGEQGVWEILYIGIALGTHGQEATIREVKESWNKPTRTVPIGDLTPCIEVPDLEDWPCSPA